MTPRRLDILAVGMLPPPLGGQALMFSWTVDRLREAHATRVIDLQAQGNLGEAGKLSPAKIKRLLRILKDAFSCIKGGKRYDILYYCPSGPSRIGILKDLLLLSILRRHAKRTIYHFHGTGGVAFLRSMNPIFAWWGRRMFFRPDIAIRCADVTPNDAADCLAARDVIISNGIPDPLGSATAALPPKNSELVFAFTGVLTEEKGIFDLVEIARHLRSRHECFTMNLIGEGTKEEVAKFDALVVAYQLQAHIRRQGVLTGQAKFDMLKQSTLFLFPTFFRAETQPLAVIEALALGIPAIVSDWRGLRSIVEDGINGAVLPPRNPEAFTEKIVEILERGALDAMRVAARRMYLERFSQQTFLGNIDALFHQVGSEL